MLPAIAAVFFQLQPFGVDLLVLGLAVIPVLTIRALKRDDFAHSLSSFPWHLGCDSA